MVEEAVAMLREFDCGEEGGGGASDDLRLRLLRSSDVLRLQRFYNALSPQSRTFFRPLGWNATYSRCAKVIAEAAGTNRYDVVAEKGGRIVGWAFLQGMDSDAGHLGIARADDFAGLGLGKRLMQRLVAEAKRQGKTCIDLILVQKNTRARKLYEQFGFRITESFKQPDGLPYYRMRLAFDRPR